jgi:hypothetical protein
MYSSIRTHIQQYEDTSRPRLCPQLSTNTCYATIYVCILLCLCTLLCLCLSTNTCYTTIYVRILLCMCSAYYFMCPHTTSCVLILLHMCAHTAIFVCSYSYICVLKLLYLCPHTTISVSSGVPADSAQRERACWHTRAMASRRQRPTQVSNVSSKVSCKVSSLLTHAWDFNDQLRSLLYAIHILYIIYIYIYYLLFVYFMIHICYTYVYFMIHICNTYILYIVYILYILYCIYICLQPVILCSSHTTIYVCPHTARFARIGWFSSPSTRYAVHAPHLLRMLTNADVCWRMRT